MQKNLINLILYENCLTARRILQTTRRSSPKRTARRSTGLRDSELTAYAARLVLLQLAMDPAEVPGYVGFPLAGVAAPGALVHLPLLAPLDAAARLAREQSGGGDYVAARRITQNKGG